MIALLVIMTAISASLRVIPFVFSKWLQKWRPLEKLAITLPLCISILLVAHMLEHLSFLRYPFALPELTALAFVAVAQALFRNVLLSMGVGVVVQQIMLRIF